MTGDDKKDVCLECCDELRTDVHTWNG